MPPDAVGLGQHVAGRHDQPPGHRPGAGDRDLLADDGAHGQLEAVGRTGHPSPRIGHHQWAENGVAPEGVDDGDGIGIEVEQLPAARDRRGEVAQVGEVQLGLDEPGPRASSRLGRSRATPRRGRAGRRRLRR